MAWTPKGVRLVVDGESASFIFFCILFCWIVISLTYTHISHYLYVMIKHLTLWQWLQTENCLSISTLFWIMKRSDYRESPFVVQIYSTCHLFMTMSFDVFEHHPVQNFGHWIPMTVCPTFLIDKQPYYERHIGTLYMD